MNADITCSHGNLIPKALKVLKAKRTLIDASNWQLLRQFYNEVSSNHLTRPIYRLLRYFCFFLLRGVSSLVHAKFRRNVKLVALN
jgi:hypothetical protein